MGKLDMKLLQGIEDTEKQILQEKQSGEREKPVVQAASGKPRDPQITKKQVGAKRETTGKENTEQQLEKKQRKQVFSFRAKISDIAAWKAYSTAAGMTMEKVGTAAMNEYIKRHKLAGDERIVFEALKARAERE